MTSCGSARRNGDAVKLVGRIARPLLAAGFGLLVAAAGALAFSLQSTVPVPQPKPERDAGGNVIVAPDLSSGLEALRIGDIAGARAVREQMTAEAKLDRHILTWAIALSGSPQVSPAEIDAARRELATWPGLKQIEANYERALYREAPPAREILSIFSNRDPETVRGAILKIRALLETGDRPAAAALAAAIWRARPLDDAETAVFTGEFAPLLARDDHLLRMKTMLYRDRIAEAKIPAQRANAEGLLQAWTLVIRAPARAEPAFAKIEPEFADDPAVLYLKIRRLRALDPIDEAAGLLEKMPSDAAALVDPGEWWVEQRIVSRGLYEKGKAKKAYEVASRHRATAPSDIVEAEFHAGWYALRGLKDPARAAGHFEKLLNAATDHRSRARGLYWLARAARDGKTGRAEELFRLAAAYPATYYGQLAAAEIGETRLAIADPAPSEADRQRFAGREAVAAIRKLEAAGANSRADMLYRGLAAELERPGEIALLAAMAHARADHRLALQVGRIAWNRDLDVAALAFPLGALPETADVSRAGLALAYAVARQESAFDFAAVSSANARGLLQLLPGTARGVAARHGLSYAPEKLTSDPAYNATLGAHYLGEQIDRFGGSYILTFVAYNAGPRRVDQWIARFGDPRGKSLDAVIDWVELIPFGETRDYVQRVLENYQVYKARLGEPADIVADLRFGRR
jgi:Soluble lytic murein transglycosylase and related regulatory proteins (some contain LysM/invasin domains)